MTFYVVLSTAPAILWSLSRLHADVFVRLCSNWCLNNPETFRVTFTSPEQLMTRRQSEKYECILELGSKSRLFETQRRHCVVSLSKRLAPLLSTRQSRKTEKSPDMTENVLTGTSTQTNKQVEEHTFEIII